MMNIKIFGIICWIVGFFVSYSVDWRLGLSYALLSVHYNIEKESFAKHISGFFKKLHGEIKNQRSVIEKFLEAFSYFFDIDFDKKDKE
jgi:hypothetical protein